MIWARPGGSGISRSKYDSSVLELVDEPGDWGKLPIPGKSGNVSFFKKRYGAGFQFVSRANEDGSRSVYGRYLGKAGAITLDDIERRNLPFSERWIKAPGRAQKAVAHA